nr:glycosyltransferase family 2 protein [Actinomycetota bacterium]
MATTIRTAQSRTEATVAEPGSPSVLAVVVTHRGREWLKECLVSLNSQTYGSMDVLVVDDASPDFRAAPHLKRVVKRHIRRRRWGFLRTPRPLGFGGAINWALSRIRTDADLLLFVHDDAALDPDAVQEMVRAVATDPSTAIVGPKVVAWDDPTRLEEVGMAVDRFGYPYKGLEADEIDLGQHDAPSEVFFVTSTCLLVRHEVFRQLRGWDARMRAFSEDLDLCWRARVAGHSVRVEPRAKARHAIALATGQRESRFLPSRYYIRRNRLRAVTKNVSTLRLLFLIPQFIFVTFAEMLGFIILRQPREIVNLARALGWNLLHFPQTLSARAKVQLGRKVSDRTLRRLTVKESTRVRSYVSHQAERLEEAWGRRADFVSQRGTQVRSVGRQAAGLPVLLGVVAIVLLLIGFRHFLWGPQASVGELLPFPARGTGMLRAYFSSWEGVGLGQPGPTSPAYFLLGLWPLITLGAAGAAQKLLILSLALVALWGAYRLMADLVDRPARWAAGVTYVLSTTGYVALREGSLGALVFASAAPFALHSLLRFTGWVRPAAWSAGREAAVLAVAGAVSASFVPGSLIIYVLALLLLTIGRAVLGLRSSTMRSVPLAVLGLAGSWVLLLPWSLTWFSPGGPLGRLTGDETWRFYASAFRGDSMASVLSGQTPGGPALMGLALPLLGLIAVLISSGQRRRTGLAMWLLVVGVGLLVEATASGAIRPIVAAPAEAGVLATLAFSGLVGLAISAFRSDLPRRGLGPVHALALAGIAGAGFLLLAGLVPSLWRGEWSPGEDSGQISSTRVEQIHSLLLAEAEQVGQFRALWVGEGWQGGVRSAVRPPDEHLLTGPRGKVLSELFHRGEGTGEGNLSEAIAAIEQGATDRGGRLLGAFNVQFVLLERGPGASEWLAQRDLAVARSETEYYVLENGSPLSRAGVYTEVPGYVQALGENDPTLGAGVEEVERSAAQQESPSHFEAARVAGPGVVFLSERTDPGWTAKLGDRTLQDVDVEWGNAWDLAPGTRGELDISFERGLDDLLWYLFTALAWIVAIGAVSPSGTRRRSMGRRRAAS